MHDSCRKNFSNSLRCTLITTRRHFPFLVIKLQAISFLGRLDFRGSLESGLCSSPRRDFRGECGLIPRTATGNRANFFFFFLGGGGGVSTISTIFYPNDKERTELNLPSLRTFQPLRIMRENTPKFEGRKHDKITRNMN